MIASTVVVLTLGLAVSSATPVPSFAGPNSYATGATPFAVAIGDLNNDGKPDVVTADSEDNTVSVLANRGDGTFPGKVAYPTGTGPTSVAVGDLSGDGKPDLATANSGTDEHPGATVSVLVNRGDGSFQAKLDYLAGDRPASVAIGDLNGDRKLDLVTANSGTEDNAGRTVSVLLNRGDGSFQAKLDYPAGNRPGSVAIADVNGDSRSDIVTANYAGNTVSVLAGNGDGTFQARLNYPTGKGPISVAVSDLNGDGKPELATANFDANTVSVLVNRGDGSFQAKHDYRSDFNPAWITIGDLNGDGKPELATANF